MAAGARGSVPERNNTHYYILKIRGSEDKNGLRVNVTRRNKMPVTVSCRPPLLFEFSSCPLISKSLSRPKGLTHYRLAWIACAREFTIWVELLGYSHGLSVAIWRSQS